MATIKGVKSLSKNLASQSEWLAGDHAEVLDKINTLLILIDQEDIRYDTLEPLVSRIQESRDLVYSARIACGELKDYLRDLTATLQSNQNLDDQA